MKPARKKGPAGRKRQLRVQLRCICRAFLSLFVVGFLAAGAVVEAEVVSMKNGRRHGGLVSFQDSSMILLRTRHRVLTLRKKDIARISYEKSGYEIELEQRRLLDEERRLRSRLAAAAAADSGNRSRPTAGPGAGDTQEDLRKRILRAREERLKIEAVSRQRQAKARVARIQEKRRKVTALRKQLLLEEKQMSEELRRAQQRRALRLHAMQDYEGALWRTMAFPGWGRIYRYDYVYGFALAAGGLFLLNNVVESRSAYSRARSVSARDGAFLVAFSESRNLGAAAPYAINAFYGSERDVRLADARRANQTALLSLAALWAFGLFDIARTRAPESSAAAADLDFAFVTSGTDRSRRGLEFIFTARLPLP